MPCIPPSFLPSQHCLFDSNSTWRLWLFSLLDYEKAGALRVQEQHTCSCPAKTTTTTNHFILATWPDHHHHILFTITSSVEKTLNTFSFGASNFWRRDKTRNARGSLLTRQRRRDQRRWQSKTPSHFIISRLVQQTETEHLVYQLSYIIQQSLQATLYANARTYCFWSLFSAAAARRLLLS